MFTEDDLQSAVRAGVLNAPAAERLKSHVANERRAVSADEENIRLVHSFNDIFVTLAILIAFSGVVSLGAMASFAGLGGFGGMLTCLITAGTAWGLAEVFTRKRRMAFPSIILFLIYQFSVAMMFSSFSVMGAFVTGQSAFVAVWVGFAALVSGGAAWLYWKRFSVPIAIASIASSAISLVGAVLFGIIAAFDLATALSVLPVLVFILGLVVFAGALAFDASDRERITQRSDIAFWLHLLAAPLMVHPVFMAFGVTSGDIGVFGALVVVSLYCVFGAIALVVDRRALLVSALLYVAIALAMLFGELGSVGLTSALSALVIGAGLLTLSVFWASLRTSIVERLPLAIQAQVPAIASTGYDGDSEGDYDADDGGRYRAY